MLEITDIGLISDAHRILSEASKSLSELLGQDVTVRIEKPFIRDEVLKDMESNISISVLKQAVIKSVCIQFMITTQSIKLKSNKREYVDARKCATYLLKTSIPGIIPDDIAHTLNYHRSNYYNNIERAEELLKNNTTFRLRCLNAEKMIKEFIEKSI
jgi:hypothetical protein